MHNVILNNMNKLCILILGAVKIYAQIYLQAPAE